MTTMTRDTHTTDTYESEWRLGRMLDHQHDCPTVRIAGSVVTLPAERKFADLESVQRYVDAVLALNWVQARWGQRTVLCKQRRGEGKAHYQGGQIHVPLIRMREDGTRWAMRETVILHEIAHAFAGPAVMHREEFREVLVALLAGCMGEEVGFVMRVLFHEVS